MKEERRKKVVQKKNLNHSSAQFQNDLDDHLEAAEEEGESEPILDNMIADAFMIECEGCKQILHTDTFFRHASKAQKCKEVYGERLEIMKKEKRKNVRKLSNQKNKTSTQEYQSKYYVKNKDSISKQKSQRFQQNLSKEKDIKKDEYDSKSLLLRNDRLERRIEKLINAWKDCRDQDVKQLRKSDAMFMDDALSLKMFDMSEKVKQTVKIFEKKLDNTIDEWKLRDKKKYNLDLEKLLDEWKIYARKTDNSFKNIEKATGKDLTCYQCIISERKCYPKCESANDNSTNKIQKFIPYDIEI